LVFDPYLGSRGGGERYMIALRDALAASGRDAVFAGPGADVTALARMGLGDVAPRAMSPWQFVAASRQFDVTVCLTNHPPVPSLARRSVVVVQFPFPDRQGNPLRRAVGRWMLRRSTIVVYSDFAREWLRTRWNIDGTVLSPPVELGVYRPDAKERLILNVGRFFSSQHSKRQDALVAAFAALPESARAGWRLVLAGGVADDADARAYLAKVQDAARGLPVEVMPNVDTATMASLYERASLYWHATGLGRGADEPEKAEHFGISTVEAMSYGAVPVVIADGGQPEIVTPDAGVLWNDESELIAASIALMADDDRRRALAQGAVRAAARFGTPSFDRGVAALADRVMQQ
jgi:glycosyltransferase involved in cell wall biosynthesis